MFILKLKTVMLEDWRTIRLTLRGYQGTSGATPSSSVPSAALRGATGWRARGWGGLQHKDISSAY